jgi:hypothetical protein
MVAAGAALLCAACFRSGVAHYGVVIDPDAGTQTLDAGTQIDAAPDIPNDAEK